MDYKDLLWPGGGAFRMHYAAAGYVQNERGEWVRPEDNPPARTPDHPLEVPTSTAVKAG